MSLVLYANGKLAADMYCANVENANGPGTCTYKPKLFHNQKQTLAFGCAGLSTTEQQATVLGAIFEDDLSRTLSGSRPEYPTHHRTYLRDTFGFDGVSFLIMTKKNLFHFDGMIYTRQADEPVAVGTGCYMALLYAREGLDVSECIHRTSELNFTVSHQHHVITRRQLKALK